MSRRERIWVGVAVAVLVVVIVAGAWVAAYDATRRAIEEEKARVAAEVEKASAAKEEQGKIGDAKNRMRPVETAVKKYYLDNQVWPENNNLQLIAPYLEQGRAGLLDPWGNPFTLQIVALQDEADGTFQERPQIICRTPTGEEIRYPGRLR